MAQCQDGCFTTHKKHIGEQIDAAEGKPWQFIMCSATMLWTLVNAAPYLKSRNPSRRKAKKRSSVILTASKMEGHWQVTIQYAIGRGPFMSIKVPPILSHMLSMACKDRAACVGNIKQSCFAQKENCFSQEHEETNF